MLPILWKMIAASAFALVLYLPLRHLRVKTRRDKPNPKRELALCLFVAYTAALALLLFLPGRFYYGYEAFGEGLAQRFGSGVGINLRPFNLWKTFFLKPTGLALFNLLFNMLLFLPVGFALPLLWPRWRMGFRIIFFAVGMPLVVEFAQLFLGRSVDLDDILLNAIGVLLGWLAWRLWWMRKKDRQKW